jgi:hypothetical protein
MRYIISSYIDPTYIPEYERNDSSPEPILEPHPGTSQEPKQGTSQASKQGTVTLSNVQFERSKKFSSFFISHINLSLLFVYLCSYDGAGWVEVGC